MDRDTTDFDIDPLAVFMFTNMEERPRSFVLRVARSVQEAFRSAGETLDLLFSVCLAAVGLWLLQPFWLSIRYPRIVHDMNSIMPMVAWGLLMLVSGFVLSAAVLFRRRWVILCIHLLSVTVWVAIGWIWGIRPVAPPDLGVLAPCFAFFTFARILQLPTQEKESTCGGDSYR